MKWSVAAVPNSHSSASSVALLKFASTKVKFTDLFDLIENYFPVIDLGTWAFSYEISWNHRNVSWMVWKGSHGLRCYCPSLV